MSEGFGFDLETTEEVVFKPLPAGKYRCLVVSAENDKYGEDGRCVKIKLQVLDGEHVNRTVTARHATHHHNEMCLSLGRAAVKLLAIAAGKPKATSPAELENAVVIATLKIKNGRNGYGDSNDVAKYEPVGATVALPAQPMARKTAENASVLDEIF